MPQCLSLTFFLTWKKRIFLCHKTKVNQTLEKQCNKEIMINDNCFPEFAYYLVKDSSCTGILKTDKKDNFN